MPVEPEPDPIPALKEALRRLQIRDRSLLRLGVGEAALTSKLAHHLATVIGAATTWDVDAEYDRERDAWEQKHGVPRPDPFTGERTETTMRPDVIIHRRGQTGPDNNLLFVEVKRFWTGVPDREDKAKAELAITRLGYRTAAVVGLHGTSGASPDNTPTFDPQAHVLRRRSADDGSLPQFTEGTEVLFSSQELAAMDRSAEQRDRKRAAALRADHALAAPRGPLGSA